MAAAIVAGVAVNKLGNFSFRTNEKLKANFEQALARRPEFDSVTDFFENCMRALIQHGRQGEEIDLPLAFLTKKKSDAS